MRSILIALAVFCAGAVFAQNLIPNPSFEDTVQLRFGITSARNWASPNRSSPEHYNPNSRTEWSVPKNYTGYQDGHSGVSYFGVKVYTLFASQGIRSARDYIQCQIKEVLVQDSIYCMQLFLTLADSSNYASRNQLGVKFSNSKISSNSTANLNEIPEIIISPTEYIQDKVNWIQYNFQYRARGGERYLTIGNFNDTNNIDTVFIGGGGDRFNLDYNATYYYIDDVYLGSCDSIPFDTGVGLQEHILEQRIRVYPNPTTEQLFISYSGSDQLRFKLYNLVGQNLGIEHQTNGKHLQLSVGHLPKGIYLLEIIAGEERITKKIVKE